LKIGITQGITKQVVIWVVLGSIGLYRDIWFR